MTADYFCIACGYPLKHGLEGNCPECGKAYSATIAGSTANAPRACPFIRLRRHMKRALFLFALPIVLLISLFFLLTYFECLELRYHVWKVGGWEVVEILGYDEEPGYTVTGAVLAVKGRPEAVVEISLNDKEMLRDGEPIRITSMKGLPLDPYDSRLLNDPRWNDGQRDYLRHIGDSPDIRDNGPLGHLFPHPIRNLDDLRVHYDEVYSVFSSFATKPSSVSAK